MNHRLTVTTAVAVFLASVSLYPLLQGTAWFWAGAGAIVIAAAAGTVTRLSALPAATVATVLALVAVAPLLNGLGWYWGLLGTAIVLVAALSVTRWRMLPVAATLITYLASQLIYLNLVFAGLVDRSKIVPTATSLRYLWKLAGQGIGERIYAPPVPAIHGVVLLATAGIGLMAVVADLIAVRLRSPAIAGLPLLALFSVPITTSAKQGAVGATVTFCLGMTGYLAILAADGRERLRIWGRLVTLWQTGRPDEETVKGPDTRALAAAGRRIGLAAVSLAIFIPLLLPGLKVHKLFDGHGSASGGGSGTVALPRPLVQLQNQLLGTKHTRVLTYTTNNPDAAAQYLQIYVLNYNGAKGDWELQLSNGSVPVSRTALPLPQGLGNDPFRAVSTKISLDKNLTGYASGFNFLPLPYAPTSLQVKGDWRADNSTLMVSSGQDKLAGLTYQVTSDDLQPSRDQLSRVGPAPHGITQQYLPFRSALRPKLRAIARRITANATNSYQKAIALEDWFTKPGRFTYTLAGGEPGTPAGLLRFLTKDREGYCQQFAFAMAVLARLEGIPSRVAVGYTAGVKQGNGSWQVTTADAHAWPELYFQGAGWLRFEPTPGGANGQGTAITPVYAGQATTPGGAGGGPILPPTTGSTGPAGGAGGGNNLPGRRIPQVGLGGGGASAGQGGSVPVAPIVGAVLLIGAIAPRTARSVMRRRRWRQASGDGGAANAAWRELRDDLTDYGISWRLSDSPRAVSRRLGGLLKLDPAAQEALDRITGAEERARYARTASAPDTLRADVGVIRRALAADATRGARWRARLLPPSAVTPAVAGLGQALDVFGWLDALGLRVRRLGRESAR